MRPGGAATQCTEVEEERWEHVVCSEDLPQQHQHTRDGVSGPTLGRNSPLHQHRPRLTCWEKALGVLGYSRLPMGHDLVAKGTLRCMRRSVASRRRRGFRSAWGGTSGVLCPVLGCPAPVRLEATGEGPAEVTEIKKGWSISLMSTS